MNLNYPLDELNLQAARRAAGETIRYCVPANISLTGRRAPGYFVIGDKKWAYVEQGEVQDSGIISEAKEYKVVPLIGNVILEADEPEGKRLLVRASMEHAGRYAYIAQILTNMAAEEPIRIYNNEKEKACAKCGGPLVHGTRVCPKCMNKAAAVKRLILLSKAHWPMLFVVLAILFAVSAVSLAGPYFQKILVNDVLVPPEGQAPNMRIFYIAIAGLFLTLVGRELLTIWRSRLMAKVSSDISADLRKLVFDKIQGLSLGFMTSLRAGDLMNRISADTDRIRKLVQEIFTTAVFQLIMLVAASVLMFTTDPLLALLIILPAPVAVYIQMVVWNKVLHKLFHKQWRIYDRANSYLHDVLSGIRVVKAFGQEKREIGKFRQYNSEFAAATIHTEKVFNVLAPVSNYIMQIGQYFVLFFGCYMIIGGTLNLGDLVQFTAYASMIYGPLAWLMNMPRFIANAVLAIDRVFAIIDEQPEIIDSEAAAQHEIQGAVTFKDVTFGYKSYEPVLKNINIDVKQGEMIGLVGHSGAGKSTLINLVSRFYDINEGELLIDGIDIRQIRQEDLRQQIGVVLQETLLFRGTIMDNIRYAKPDATLEEVIQAAKIANAHDFIVRMPDAYDTRLEENGNNLSGGERQRIAIARAVLHNPRMIILDEATASLDVDTEASIQEALQRLTKGRTTIAIAHRLSTLRNADRLVVLDHGRVAEIGTHNELLEKKGIYHDLVMAQRNMAKAKAELAG